MDAFQLANLNEILGIINTFQITINGVTRVLTPEESYTAAWIAYAESRYRQYAENPRSTAKGIYQYTDPTWTARFYEYGSSLGYGTDTGEKARWDGSIFDIDLQTKVFLLDYQNFLATKSANNDHGWYDELGWDRGGPLSNVTARDAMEYYGVPWTEENYLYLRHHTDVREVKAILFDRLVKSGYTEAEQFLESYYGQPLTDNYDNPSLTPLIQQLADMMELNISNMNNQEALGYIKSTLGTWTGKGVDVLRNCFAGYKPWDDSKLWKYDPRYKYIRWFMLEHARDYFTAAGAAPTPIILDLDGDGVETTNIAYGGYFDHDGNGFAEQTGWVGSDDGLLVWDRNEDGIINDGKELFGDNTIFQNSERAENGFQALAEWDDNEDGKIDVNDAIWENLKVWQDYDGDGYSRQVGSFS